MDSFEKDALRAQIRQAKRALTPAQIASASAELAAALRRHPLYRQARSLYGYLSYNQEVETHALLLQAQRDGKRVAVPKVTGPGEMVFYWLDELTQAAPGYCGIPEPDGSQPAADDDTALVLTPGRAIGWATAAAFTTAIWPHIRTRPSPYATTFSCCPIWMRRPMISRWMRSWLRRCRACARIGQRARTTMR